MGKMSLSIYLKRRYEDFCGFGRRKNKANSKPNKANFGLPTAPKGVGIEKDGRADERWAKPGI